ncbi:MAG: hypothetical protein M9939_00880 [Mesorhizobium sp.]|nr:hypothetical protein [Mesorhizobium sp.]MCO5159662.1 hypothetical protein [Mesorhizobium sp.]
MTHTPTPWEACERGDYSDDGIVILGDDRRIAVVNHEEDAALIVHAVNSLPALVKALEDMLTVADMTTFSDQFPLECENARAALASHKTGG